MSKHLVAMKGQKGWKAKKSSWVIAVFSLQNILNFLPAGYSQRTYCSSNLCFLAMYYANTPKLLLLPFWLSDPLLQLDLLMFCLLFSTQMNGKQICQIFYVPLSQIEIKFENLPIHQAFRQQWNMMARLVKLLQRQRLTPCYVECCTNVARVAMCS